MRSRLPLAPSVLYLLLGAVVSVVLGRLGISHLSPIRNHELFERICQLALVIAVFGSGLAVERQVSRHSAWLIAVLLVVGIPATIAAIAWFGSVAMGLPLGAAVLLGAVLAPTDPVLAGDLGLGTPGEAELGEPRLSLHTEAGANDGLASPFVLAGLLVATHSSTGWLGHWLAADIAYKLGVALVIGGAGGWLTAFGLDRWHDREPERPRPGIDTAVSLVLAFALYALTQWVGGYGLVAVFLAGIVFRRCDHDELLSARLHGGGETIGRVLEFVVLVLLGAALTSAGLAVPGLRGWLLAPLLIVLIRPLLVLGAAAGAPFGVRPRLYLGFFGVRGVAALYYAVVVAGDHVLNAHQTAVVVWTTIVCVVVSIVVHGITATPLTRFLLGPQEPD